MASNSDETINLGPSTSQGRTRPIPTYRGGYLSSDEEADCQIDTINATTMLEGVALKATLESEQDVRSHGDAPLSSDESDNEQTSINLQRKIYPSSLTIADTAINIDHGSGELTRKITSTRINLKDIGSERPKEQISDPGIKPEARTSTLERITKKVTKHFQSKTFTVPYNLRSRANIQKTSKRIRKSAKNVVNKGRFMLKASSKFVPNFFKKD